MAEKPKITDKMIEAGLDELWLVQLGGLDAYEWRGVLERVYAKMRALEDGV